MPTKAGSSGLDTGGGRKLTAGFDPATMRDEAQADAQARRYTGTTTGRPA